MSWWRSLAKLAQRWLWSCKRNRPTLQRFIRWGLLYRAPRPRFGRAKTNQPRANKTCKRTRFKNGYHKRLALFAAWRCRHARHFALYADQQRQGWPEQISLFDKWILRKNSWTTPRFVQVDGLRDVWPMYSKHRRHCRKMSPCAWTRQKSAPWLQSSARSHGRLLPRIFGLWRFKKTLRRNFTVYERTCWLRA